MSDSFYLQRVKDCLTQTDRRYDQIGSYQYTRWCHNKQLPQFTKVTLSDITFHEEEYKGYQLIVIGWHYDLQLIFDKNDEPFTHSDIEEQQIGRYGEVMSRSQYYAYAWKIGNTEQVVNLAWLGQLTTLNGICSSAKEQTTLRSARKKLDLLEKVQTVKYDIITTSNVRINRNSAVNPYNAVVGDKPFIQAHGRLRQGKIIDTTGSRFVVAYCTPSNTEDLKYKILPLSQLWIEA
jgi:hypothetical protein